MKKNIYIFNDGELRRKDDTICLDLEGKKRYLPAENINEIFVYGETNFNKKFIEFISEKEILLHFFNYYGYYVGTYYPREHYNSGYMILKQAEHYLNEVKRFNLAKKFVEGAAVNMLQVLKYYKNRGKDVTDSIDNIERLKLGLVKDDINELMGQEGNIREYYLNAFNRIVNNPNFYIKERNRRPPQDPMNVMISFGNSLMYTTVLGEIYKTHLDPRIGYLHSTNFRRFTLNLDVAEIFKPVIIDRLIFGLIDKSMITEKDFTKAMDGMILSENAKKTFISEFDNKMKTTIKQRNIGKEESYRMIIRMELYKIEKHLMEEQEYMPFVAQW